MNLDPRSERAINIGHAIRPSACDGCDIPRKLGFKIEQDVENGVVTEGEAIRNARQTLLEKCQAGSGGVCLAQTMEINPQVPALVIEAA